MSALDFNLKLEAMRREWKLAQDLAASLQQALTATKVKMSELQTENQKLRKKLSSDEMLLSSGASVLAALLWKASDSPRVIHQLLQAKSKMSVLFKFFSGRLSKCATLSDVFNLGKEDADLIHSLGGILVNLLVSRQTCDVILCDDCGRALLLKIIHLLDHLHQTPPQNEVQEYGKAIFLMILYNMSLESSGAQLLRDNRSLLKALCKDFLKSNNTKARILEIRILDSMMSQSDADVLQIIQEMLPLEKLIKFGQVVSKDKEVAGLVRRMVVCLKELHELCEAGEVLECPREEGDSLAEASELEVDEDYIAEILDGLKQKKPGSDEKFESAIMCFDLVNVK